MAKYKIIPSSRTIVHSPISIGHKAEKGVEAIEFDLTAWVETYGSGTLTVIMRRWGDAIPYPIVLEIDENNKATWTLSDIDTAKAGMAYAQLSYIVGETVVKKSDIYTFRVMDSLTGEGEPPEAYESWLEHLTHLAAEAMAEVLDIEGIVTDKTLSVDGGIADAKKVGDELSDIKADLDSIVPGLSNSAKEALLACFAHAGWTDENGQDYYDALAAALETNTYWDFEWYAESEELPAGMEYTSAEFVTRNGEKLLKVANPTLTFNHYGDCELEIEGKWEHFDPSIRYWNTVPQLIIAAANHGVNGNDGFKTFCFRAQNDNTVYTNVSGSTQSTQIDGTEKLSVYKLKFENGSGLLKVDGSVVASGAGVTKDAYIYNTGIYDNTTNQNYGLVIKSIKFRKMRVAPEDTRQLPDDYTWLYDATAGDLLSEQNYATASTVGPGTETIIDDQLVMNVQPTSDTPGGTNYIRFSFADSTSNNAKVSARVKFDEIPFNNEIAEGAEGFRLQLSNGESGAQVFFTNQLGGSNDIGACYYEGSNKRYVDLSEYNSADYHIIELELKNGTQKAKIDGNIIFSSSTLSTNYCTANAVLNQASTSPVRRGTVTTVDWMAFNEVS